MKSIPRTLLLSLGTALLVACGPSAPPPDVPDAPAGGDTVDTPVDQPTDGGIAHDNSESRVMLVSVEDKPGVVARIFSALAEESISVDMIIQNAAKDAEGRTDVTFTVATTDMDKVRPIMDGLVSEVGARGVFYDDDIAKVSIVGLGMRSHAGVAAQMFDILAREGINIQAISTSEIKISCLVQTKYAELAVRALHDGFGLEHAPATNG